MAGWAGIGGIGLALLGEILLIAEGFPSPLLCPTALLTAGLALPLWLATVMHPPLTATEAGLIVRPMFWRASLVPWDAIRAVRPHTLIPADEPGRRLLEGRRRYRPREGRWIVVNGSLPILFRLVGAGRWAGEHTRLRHQQHDARRLRRAAETD